MKQKILVAVTGMTPQIVTETVYALHKNHQWLPEKIIVLTTLQGKQKIMDTLLGKNNQLARLQQDYALPEIQFNEQNIKVISENNQELDDIRTAQQNNAAADLIVREIYQLCQDKNTELHVSIAGGRKSMGFYVGYALSLFGRAQDKMSHVLVEEGFEQHREFFYPPTQSQMLTMHNNNQQRDAAKAEIMLAEIPFVRMAEGRIELALNSDTTFSQAVQKTQEMLNGVSLQIHSENRTIGIISKSNQSVIGTVKLSPTQMALYLAVRDFCQQGRDVILNNNHDETIKDFANCYLQYYQQYKSELRGNSVSATQNRNNELVKLIAFNAGTLKCNILNLLQEHSSRIGSAFQKELGDYGLQFAIQSDGGNNQKRYFVNYLD